MVPMRWTPGRIELVRIRAQASGPAEGLRCVLGREERVSRYINAETIRRLQVQRKQILV